MRKAQFISQLVLIFSLTLFGAPALAEDVAKGEKVFKRCKACHYADKEKNKTGPYLVDVIGRKAGSIDGYKYSKAMRESQLVWDDATLTAYLKAPKKFLKGTKMAFAGLKKEADIKNVIAYLKTPK
jgi:cytochrome c